MAGLFTREQNNSIIQMVGPMASPSLLGINVMKDIFSLDLPYPNDIWSMASIADPSGKSYHLAVRVNHPPDKAIYLYHSECSVSCNQKRGIF